MKFDHEEHLADGLRYAETADEAVLEISPGLKSIYGSGPRPVTFCVLQADGVDEPVSYLVRAHFSYRFGEIAIPVEGYGAVATVPAHREKGYVSRLLRKVVERSSQQADAVFLFGVSKLYSKFGFTPCMIEAEFVVPLHVLDRAEQVTSIALRPMRADDSETARDLFNRAHRDRPCSVVRGDAHKVEPRERSDWNAGDAGIVAERDGQLLGYCLFSTDSYGQRRPMNVRELVGVELDAVSAMIREVADVAVQRRMERVVFHEPPDSLAGLALKRIGATSHVTWPCSCDGQGLICNRRHLVDSLADELERRAGKRDEDALEAMAGGTVCTDDRVLLPLLTGFSSWQDGVRSGHALPDEHAAIMKLWFPGGGTPMLPLPYTHRSDRY